MFFSCRARRHILKTRRPNGGAYLGALETLVRLRTLARSRTSPASVPKRAAIRTPLHLQVRLPRRRKRAVSRRLRQGGLASARARMSAKPLIVSACSEGRSLVPSAAKLANLLHGSCRESAQVPLAPVLKYTATALPATSPRPSITSRARSQGFARSGRPVVRRPQMVPREPRS